MPNDPLDFRSLFLHAWDIADAGVDPLLGWIAETGLNTMCVAGTYHSGWFIHPSHSNHRAFMTEGSVCYFHPDASLYRETRLQPTVSKICTEKDWLAEAGRRLDHFGLRMVSWTIGTHHSRFGLAYPDLTQQNVYGDRFPHALCISNDEVRAYLLAICRDLATHYPMHALQLESFDWMSVAHGHHHERDLVMLSPLEQELFSLCFCPACVRRATSAGVDCQAVATAVRKILDATFREAPDRPPNHPVSINELEDSTSGLRDFNQWRRNFANSLIAEIKTIALAGTSCRLLMQTPFDPGLQSIADGFAYFAYGQTPAQVSETCRAARKAIPSDYPGLIQCLIRLGRGIPDSEAQLRQIVQAVGQAGFNGINFYNRSEAPPKMLSWLRGAIS